MRRLILTLTASGLLLIAPAALAAPTCMDATGDGMKCGSPGAMPVGWRLSPQQQLIHDERVNATPLSTELLALVLGIVGMAALVSLLPKFDGRLGADWDRQEGDEA